jgi:hypothetical protein
MGFKALLVGINAYADAPLRGCVNDVHLIRDLLRQVYRLPDEQMRMLLDADANRAAILEHLRWLAEPDAPDDPTPPLRLFHFSGHGTFVADTSGTEPDGQNEALCPVDDMEAGVITDDALRELYDTFPPNTHLLLTMDCCHAGDIHFAPGSDVLPRYRPVSDDEQRRIELARRQFIARQLERRSSGEPPLEETKQRFGRDRSADLAVLLAACRADQTAADARFGETYHGALSFYLVEALREVSSGLSYGEVVDQVRHAVSSNKFTQVPQLDCSDENRGRPFLNMRAEEIDAAPPAPAPAPAVRDAAAATPAPAAEPESPLEPDPAIMSELPPDFFDGLLPFEEDADEGAEGEVSGAYHVDRSRFLYVGRGLKPAEFADYVQRYQFGSQPPNYVILHHTAVPGTVHANGGGWLWDSGEEGLNEDQIYRRRLARLNGIKEYYRTRLRWDRGPHLFIDDRWIWLFTPMYHTGIHAAEGNQYRTGARLNYSIGIEVVGHYERTPWPEPVEQLVGYAVAVLKERLGTFELQHQRFAGGVSSHRDYNKPTCPGAAISESYYLDVLRRGWSRLRSGTLPGDEEPETEAMRAPITPNSPLLGPASGRRAQAVAFIQAALPPASEYTNDVDLIMSYYWKYAPPVGVDPFLAACQCIFETNALRSYWAARPRRNPAGLGVRQEGGLAFATWEDGVQAHIGQILAFALHDHAANGAQRQMMQKNPRHRHIAANLRGAAPTLAGFDNRWTDDPNYAAKLVRRAMTVRER